MKRFARCVDPVDLFKKNFHSDLKVGREKENPGFGLRTEENDK